MKRALLVLGSLPAGSTAHVGQPLEPHDLFTVQAWVWDPWILLLLLLAAVLYWRGDGPGHGIRQWEAWCYWTGWVILAAALVSPLHTLGEVLFSAHMLQHELLMIGAAPLLVLGRPLVPFVWALPSPWRRPAGKPFHARAVQTTWRSISNPLHAGILHGAALWIWHAPSLYQASVRSDAVHTLQHLSFLLTALLFWWSLLRNPRTRDQFGASAMYLFGTALHSSMLGALLTFAPSVWYPVYSTTTQAWGLTPLDDQQLGGLIMWVPGGLLYSAIGLALIGIWLRQADVRACPSKLAQPLIFTIVIAGVAAGISCSRPESPGAPALTTKERARARELITLYGCGACHEIPGVRNANGLVGPALGRIGVRTHIAGVLPNNADNLVRWIRHPLQTDPHTLMPEMYVPEEHARLIAAYLMTLP